MKNLKIKIPDKKVIYNIFLASFLLILCCFLYINQFSIYFYSNGFSKISNMELQVYYFDVGQANASLIIFPSRTCMLIDTGSKDSEESFIQNVDYILSKNEISEIDFLVLTHSDEDHVGGCVALLEKFQVNNILRPKLVSINETNDNNFKVVETKIYNEVISAVYKEPDCEVEFIENLTIFLGENVEIKICASEKDYYEKTNSYSPFIFIEYMDKTFLFTGDATDVREKELVEKLKKDNLELKVDFLLVAHHGSSLSSTTEFLNATNPKYAIVSSGSKHFPSNEVLARLKDANVSKVFCTKSDGMIGVGVQENGDYEIKTATTFVDVPLIVVLSALIVFLFINLNNIRKQNIINSHNKFSFVS